MSHGDGTQKPGTRLNVQSAALSLVKKQPNAAALGAPAGASSEDSVGSEKSTEGKGKGKDEWDTKAPGPVIGMQDERGTKEH